MNDKQQLAAMGEHLAEQEGQPMCMAKRVDELEEQWRAIAGLLSEAHEALRRSIPLFHKDLFTSVDLIDRISAALEGKPTNHIEDVRGMVPEGWQLVPVDPTPEMLDAGYFTNRQANAVIYRDMLAAAPKTEPNA